MKLSNIPLKHFRKFLEFEGYNRIDKGKKGRGGHEKWSRKDSLRPIVLQSHIDPVPERIVKQCMRHMGMEREEFVKALEEYFNS